MPPTFQLFTSLRYDPLLLTSPENSRPDLNFLAPSPFYMLAYHRDRMVEAAQHFDFAPVVAALADGAALHATLLGEVRAWQEKEGSRDGPLKVRVCFDAAGSMTVNFVPVPPVPLATLYPTSFAPPREPAQKHPAQAFTPSPLTGGPSDSLPAGNQDPNAAPRAAEWLLHLDTAPTPRTPFTLLKTTQRGPYTASRARAIPAVKPAVSSDPPSAPSSAAVSPAALTDVILFNAVREVTESTLASLYFWRGGKWVTPPVGVPEAYKLPSAHPPTAADEGELRAPFAGRWGHSVRSAKVGAGGQRGTSRRWALGKGFCMEEGVDVETVRVGEGVWVSNGVRGFGWGRVVG
ncbi:hypothetical protein C7974DRAFT_314433 [Boeremia exigua]|uniref:uncharacterized protein n=1 Tax=Boeremia exigua TaxID=749465 RepID=UPI001E8D965F|nr:uncharacterized protein C7974DRAFT_314433 [Boeremia exigua]KAH6621942.1 hypothetical protein C7974DRAFT_314433 [Boeremia exigua]